MFFSKKKQQTNKKTQSRDDIRAVAMENARRARAEIGEETLQKIAAALSEENKSAGVRAREQIQQTDRERIAQHLKDLLSDGRG